MDYSEFLASKAAVIQPCGIEVQDGDIHPMLFQFQRDLVRWAVRKGRAAIFADTGLGKTFMQLEWARLLGQRGLILAPLSVARQTVREAAKIGIEVHYTRSGDDLTPGINITNYEMADHFDAAAFGAIVLDESSALKSFDSVYRKQLTAQFASVPYRLCCTATPAPNDHIELGNHAEFLGVCTQAEMKSMFFINANKQHLYEMGGQQFQRKGSNAAGTEWRLKHAAEKPFYKWLSQWAMSITKPSDLGYDDNGFILPPLNIMPQFVLSGMTSTDELFATRLHGIADRQNVRRVTTPVRLAALRTVIDNGDNGQWVIWCGQDAEQDSVAEMLGGQCVSIYGSLSPDEKETRLEQWLAGDKRFLVTKPRVCGFGLNLQCAHNTAFFGLSDSWETWYQCIRREYRFGQTQPVNVHVILSDMEEEIYHNVMRKEALATRLRKGLIEQVRQTEMEALDMATTQAPAVARREDSGHDWRLINGDSCEWLKEVPSDSVDLSVYSPPFFDLFTYTDSPRDLGNSKDWAEFSQHYAFIVSELLRVTKPGRFCWVHTAEIPAMRERDGYLGLKDFPGDVIRAHEAGGWTYWDRVIVPKNPQSQAVRTHANALLFVTLRKDSASSRTAIFDHVLCFKKPGENAVPIRPVEHGEMTNDTWIDWATGVWMGIRETETLQQSRAEKGDDEKHVCPLQLGTIERCLKLKSNPGELILDPFSGIGSTGYQALRFGRRFVGCELKPSYFDLAVRNLHDAEISANAATLFDLALG
jgi:DNA modification methylase